MDDSREQLCSSRDSPPLPPQPRNGLPALAAASRATAEGAEMSPPAWHLPSCPHPLERRKKWAGESG